MSPSRTLAIVGALFTAMSARAAESDVSDTELDWMLREVAPVVEQVAGRPFVHLPELVSADPDAIARVVYEEQLHLLASVEGLSPEDADHSARRTAASVSGAFAGKYGFLDGRLYVSVDGIRDSLRIRGEPEWLLRPMIRVVIAHELAHALQDQHTHLEEQVADAASADAIMAINCAVEGHAVWVHETVGARMGHGEAVALMTELLGADQPVRRRMDPGDFYQVYVYGLGRDFVAWHAEHGGTEQVWRVLDSPPQATSAIVRPATWDSPTSSVDPELRRVLERSTRRLGARGWRPEDGAMGDYDVRDQLVRAGGDSGLADDLDVGWNSRLVGGAMRAVEIQLLRFNSEDGAAAFVDDMQRQAEAQARAVGVDPFIRADAGPYERVRGDRSAHEAITMSLLGLSPEDRLGRVWVARGSDVVQVVLMNAPASEREVAAEISRVFRGVRSR